MNKHIAILLLAFSGTSEADVLLLSCNMTHGNIFYFSIDISSDAVKYSFSDNTRIRIGKYEKTDTHYLMRFPETDLVYGARAIIDRFSGTLNWKVGRPPFGANMDNIHQQGQCKKIPNKPVL